MVRCAGPSGSHGYSPSFPLYPGARGNSGTVEIIVDGSRRGHHIETYGKVRCWRGGVGRVVLRLNGACVGVVLQRYDLVLREFSLEEEVRVKGLFV